MIYCAKQHHSSLRYLKASPIKTLIFFRSYLENESLNAGGKKKFKKKNKKFTVMHKSN